MEKIGLGSAILMIKFNFLENRMVCMKKYKTIFNNKYYSTKEVTQLEILCLMLTNYDLNLPTPSSFMEIFLLNKIIFYMDYAKKETRRNIYNLIMNTLENILFESNEYIKYKHHELSYTLQYQRNKKLKLQQQKSKSIYSNK